MCDTGNSGRTNANMMGLALLREASTTPLDDPELFIQQFLINRSSGNVTLSSGNSTTTCKEICKLYECIIMLGGDKEKIISMMEEQIRKRIDLLTEQ
jgi:hypothetical protein